MLIACFREKIHSNIWSNIQQNGCINVHAIIVMTNAVSGLLNNSSKWIQYASTIVAEKRRNQT
ncbi:hypothetical protein T11_7243 [Trichinella zimbabwensis]|uniref:Uncharacterized protein n=1 Tax=Trichinella zimbabwensis TaxID=268475 RepID=A0A0V1I5E4_9BILA|nr:hypothetical protein T11_7243 [Trichinella zimbabwensis]